MISVMNGGEVTGDGSVDVSVVYAGLPYGGGGGRIAIVGHSSISAVLVQNARMDGVYPTAVSGTLFLRRMNQTFGDLIIRPSQTGAGTTPVVLTDHLDSLSAVRSQVSVVANASMLPNATSSIRVGEISNLDTVTLTWTGASLTVLGDVVNVNSSTIVFSSGVTVNGRMFLQGRSTWTIASVLMIAASFTVTGSSVIRGAGMVSVGGSLVSTRGTLGVIPDLSAGSVNVSESGWLFASGRLTVTNGGLFVGMAGNATVNIAGLLTVLNGDVRAGLNGGGR